MYAIAFVKGVQVTGVAGADPLTVSLNCDAKEQKKRNHILLATEVNQYHEA